MIEVKNRLITASITDVLYSVKRELKNGKLKDITPKGNNIVITCPIHKDGRERKPSCYIYSVSGDEHTTEGKCHCFTCGYVAEFPQLVADLFDESLDFAERWLIDKFGDVLVAKSAYLPPIELEKPKKKQVEYLDESVLLDYDWYHPYMWQRKLSKETVDKFRVGYDKDRDAITFPVYDENHKLAFVTARSVRTKRFWIPEGVLKPCYLLYDTIERKLDTVYLVESQINALTLHTWGFNGVALFGTGTPDQYNILKKSGIRNFVLCFDGDEAGQKGARRFIKNMGKDSFITVVNMPAGKDINDLTREEFIKLLNNS